MRYVCLGIAALAASILIPVEAVAQAPAGLSISNYQLIGEQRATRTESYFTYRAELINVGPARAAITATLSSKVASTKVAPGQGTLQFGPVPANGRVPSANTFTIRVDRTVLFSFADLQWTFSAPVANAGTDQTAPVGSTVTLNGSGSSNPSGQGALTYRWKFASIPAGSYARLSDAAAVMPTFVVDAPGMYVLTLTVSNGTETDTASVTVNTSNSAPVASAGPNQSLPVGSSVFLNGSGSFDVDGDPLTYSWTLAVRPPGSTATLQGTNSVTPTFVIDKPDTYVLQLTVSDGRFVSAPSTVIITTQNTPPLANVGSGQVVKVGDVVEVNGSGSTDVDGDLLSYQWTLIMRPTGSAALLSNPSTVSPTFSVDQPGTYIAQLVVNDGKSSSNPTTVTITTDKLAPPTADAGANQTVRHGETVILVGRGVDQKSLPLTYQWSLIGKPQTSSAALQNSTVGTAKLTASKAATASTGSTTTFLADQPGTYVGQLVVSNGLLTSEPATVTITTTNTQPVANAGPSQNAPVGAIVTLDGNASSDADNDPLRYAWTFTSKPAGSAAALSGASSPSPTFFADVAGIYVAQLIVNDGFTNSNPATVQITVAANTIVLSPDPLNLFGASGTLGITLPTPAGPGGVIVKLASLDPNVATVPATVTIPENSKTAFVTVTPVSTGATLVSASVSGIRPGTATVTVGTPQLSIALAAGTVGLTRTVSGTVTLSAPAPVGGAFVALTANPTGIVSLQPTTVNIAAGATEGNFTVTGVSEGSTVIAASSPGYTGAGTPITVGKLGLIVLPAGLTVPPGQSAPFQVSLATPAPVGGVVVTLISSDTTKLTITPATVTIPQGATSPATPPQVNGISLGSAAVTASAPGLTGATTTVRVAAALTFSPQSLSVSVGAAKNLTLTLSGPAPASGLAVSLTSNRPDIATVPSTANFAANATSISLPITGVAQGSAIITATAGVNVTGATANITVLSSGNIIVPGNVSVGLGKSVQFPVSLSTPAPVGGLALALSSNDPSRVTVTPATITIAAGQTLPTTQPQVTGLKLGSATISVTAPGYSSVSGGVQVSASLSLAPASVTVSTGASQNVTLTLSAPAPAGGVVVSVSSDNPNVATVPATVTIPQSSASVSLAVSGIAAGSTIIRATGANLTTATSSVTVQGGASIIAPASISLSPTKSAALAIRLSSAAPVSGVSIALTSSDPSKVSVSPASVFIAGGQTQPSTQPQVQGINFGSANITASTTGFAPATTAVQVGALLSLSPQILALAPGTSQNLTVTLSSPAPAGGLVVALRSSATLIATTPSSVTIAQNAMSVTTAVAGVAAGSAVITASAAVPNVSGATATVNVQSLGVISLPSSTKVNLGQSAAFPVTLGAPAASGGVTVNLASSNSGRVSITPASVVIAGGQTQPAQQPQITGVTLGAANITASALGYATTSKSVQVTATLSFTPVSLTMNGTDTRNLTLTLSGPAPAGGITVNLTSSAPGVAIVPATVTIAQNTNTVIVPVTSLTPGATVIRAVAPNVTEAVANVTVAPAADIILPTNVTVAPGEQAVFPVVLGKPAVESVFVDLTVSDPTKASLTQQSIFIASGRTEPSVQPKVNGLNAGSVTVTAKAFGLATSSTTVDVGFAMSFVPPTLTITGKSTQNLTISLTGPAPSGGLTVNLSSSNAGVATVPATVVIGANQTTGSVPVTGVTAGTTVIRAIASNMADTTATVSVVNPGAIMLPSGVNLPLGQTRAFAVTLSTPAPIGGLSVTLSSNNTSRVTVSPAIVNIPAGQTQPLSQPTIAGVNVGPVIITAVAPGYTSASQTVQVSATVTFTQSTLTLAQNSSGSLLLALSASAPWVDGVAVTLSSSNTNVATVQPSVNFYPDGSEFTTVVIPVSALSPGTATIRASGLNIPEVAAVVTVTGPLGISTTSLPKGSVGVPYSFKLVAVGGTPPLTWTLTSGALPAGLSLVTSTGEIRGTPTAAANATPLSFRVVDSASPARAAVANLSLTISQSGPSSVNPNAGTPQSAPTGTAFGQLLSAIVRDASNNPVSGVTVTFTAPASGASGTFAGGPVTSAVTNASGIATAGAFTANSIAGSYTVTARVTGVTTPATFSLTNTSAAPKSITPVSGTPQSAVIKTAFGLPLSVAVKDAASAPVSGVTVIFKAPATGATGTFAGGVSTAVTNASGIATSQIFTANSTAGAYSVAASVSGVTPDAIFSLTNRPGLPATIAATGGTPQSTLRGTAFPSRLLATVRDSGNNPLNGVTVTFTAPSTGASGTFAGGVNTAVTNASGVATSAIFTANNTAGTYQVSASVGAGVPPAAFNLTNTGPVPSSIMATGGTPQSVSTGGIFPTPFSVLVRDSNNSALSGVTVTFTAPSAGASGTFAGGVNTAVTNASGIATSAAFRANLIAGSYSVVASVSGLAQTAAFALTNVEIPTTPAITITSASVGQGLQTPLTITLPEPAPLGGLNVTVTSGDPTRLLIAGRPGDAGTASISFRISEGLTTAGGIFAQGLAASGTVQVTAAGGTWTAGKSNITLTPAGFVATGPAGLGVSEFVVPRGLTATVTVMSVRLNSALQVIEGQQLRGGTSVVVPIANAVSTVGSISPASVALNGGEATATSTFLAINTGITTLTPAVPTGFSKPVPNSVNARVPEGGMTADTVTVGQNLQTTAAINLSAAVPSGGLVMTLTSNDPSKLLLSATAGTAGSASITLNLQAGRTRTQDFYVHGLGNSGTASYRATAAGFTALTAAVNLRPSGFVISGPFGLGADFYTTPGAANADLMILPAVLDTSRNYVGQQPVRAGLTVNVPVTSSNTAVGTITASPVVLTGNSTSALTRFNPISAGTTTLLAGVPAGFSAPAQNASITASVRTPSLSLTSGITIGRTLQAIGTVLLGEAAPVGGLAVTLTSNSGLLQLSSSATAAGANSITITVPAGQSSASYYIQSSGDTGTVNYTGAAPGYQSKTASVTLTPSGVVIAGPFGFGFPLTAAPGEPSKPVSVIIGQLDPATSQFIAPQALAGGRSLAVSLTPPNSSVGTVTTPVTIVGGSDTAIAQFKPIGTGSTTIGVNKPAFYTQPANNTVLAVLVQ